MSYAHETFTYASSDLYTGNGLSADITPTTFGNYAPADTHALLRNQVTLSGLDAAGGTLTVGVTLTRNGTTYERPTETISYAAGQTAIFFEMSPILLLSSDTTLTLTLKSDNSNDTSVTVVVQQVNLQQVNAGAVSESIVAADNVEANIPNLNGPVTGAAQAQYYTAARAALLDNLANLDQKISEILTDAMTKPVGRADTYKEAIAQLYQRFFGPVEKRDTLKVYDDDETTVLTTQEVYTRSDGTEVLGKAT